MHSEALFKKEIQFLWLYHSSDIIKVFFIFTNGCIIYLFSSTVSQSAVTRKKLNNQATVQIAAEAEIFLQHWKDWLGG
jgi:hypothetical protein